MRHRGNRPSGATGVTNRVRRQRHLLMYLSLGPGETFRRGYPGPRGEGWVEERCAQGGLSSRFSSLRESTPSLRRHADGHCAADRPDRDGRCGRRPAVDTPQTVEKKLALQQFWSAVS